MWLTEEWHYWAKWMSNSSHRMLALLFITYFPMPKTVFPSGLTSVALLKCNYLLASLQEKKNNDFWPEEPLLWMSNWCSTVLPSRGNIKRDESHYSFVLARLGVNKMCGFMSSGESTVNGKQTCSGNSKFLTRTTECFSKVWLVTVSGWRSLVFVNREIPLGPNEEWTENILKT